MLFRSERDFQLPGYYTVELGEKIVLHKGERFVVVENISSVRDGKTGSYINLETNMAKETLALRDLETGEIIYAVKGEDGSYLNDGNGHLISDPEKGEKIYLGAAMGYLEPSLVCNDGETYIQIQTKDGLKWITPSELTQSYNGGNTFVFGNALIKAFTVNYEEPTDPVDPVDPTEPTEPEKPEVEKPEKETNRKTSNKDKSTPHTGDATFIAPVAEVMLAGLGLAAAGLKRKQD